MIGNGSGLTFRRQLESIDPEGTLTQPVQRHLSPRDQKERARNFKAGRAPWWKDLLRSEKDWFVADVDCLSTQAGLRASQIGLLRIARWIRVLRGGALSIAAGLCRIPHDQAIINGACVNSPARRTWTDRMSDEPPGNDVPCGSRLISLQPVG